MTSTPQHRLLEIQGEKGALQAIKEVFPWYGAERERRYEELNRLLSMRERFIYYVMSVEGISLSEAEKKVD